MGFALKFHLDALSEWDALDKGVRYALKKNSRNDWKSPTCQPPRWLGPCTVATKSNTTKPDIDWCTTSTTPKSSF